MKIFITGSKGMVGRSICEHHDSIHHEIIKPSSKDLNLLDAIAVEDFIQLEKPDLIIHAAGVVGGIQANLNQPKKFFYDNLQMGINLINCSKNLGIKKFLNIASSCMYPRNAVNPLKEEEILKGELEPTNEGYALAKICVERLCRYINSEDKSFIYKTLIPCNIYGKYDKFSPKVAHMVPAVIYRIYEAKINNINEIKIWGDGKARREFMYNEDLADAIWFSVKKINDLPQTINIGMGKDYSISEYYKEIGSVMKFNGNYIYDLTKPIGMKKKLVDSSKINELGWQPNFNLKEGIKLTYEYFLSVYKDLNL